MDRLLRVVGTVVVAVIALRVLGWAINGLAWLFWVGLVVAAIALPIAWVVRRVNGSGRDTRSLPA